MSMTGGFAMLATVAVVLVPASTGSGIPGAHGLHGLVVSKKGSTKPFF